jgi:hypothetical protein
MNKILVQSILAAVLPFSIYTGKAQTIHLDSAITIIGKVISFDSTKHILERCHFSNRTTLCLIDGKQFFGTEIDRDNEPPRNHLKSLQIIFRGQVVDLDVSGMYNPSYENRIYKDQFQVDDYFSSIVLRANFSDGGASYQASWRIIKGTSIRTMLNWSD